MADTDTEKRSVGPVTLATGGAAAATTIICWVLSLAGVDVPGEVQGSITVLLVLAAGYAVRPASRGRYAA
ncbi:membrane protein [Arthrobacter phage Mendel]|uniref:Holin n=1 Tax=Arthrobacter phage Mendel TaxID=2484218 RepID=A0A3G3M1S5_9CAUD|nr:membrane protein [Arthrobacter phage Mendel]AYQ99933.1 hypothetical protein PBI_MENDEL_19 [Arthrobacter phage Mendel]